MGRLCHLQDGWPPTIAKASTRPCDSTFAPTEHQWCLSRERSWIDHPKETPGQARETHPPPTEVVPTINRGTISKKTGAPCTSGSMRTLAQEEVQVSCRPQSLTPHASVMTPMSTQPTVCAALRWATVSHLVQQLYLTPVPIHRLSG